MNIDLSQLAKDIGAACGLDHLAIENELPARQGTSAKLRTGTRTFLLKAAHTSDETGPEGFGEPRWELIQREAKVLQAMPELASNMYAADGRSGDVVWLLIHWLKGENARDYSSKLREVAPVGKKRKRFAELFSTMADQVASLHEAGFLHGDLQPAHFLLDRLKTYLVDFELSRHINDHKMPYSGALLHYISPEVATGMLRKSSSIHIDERSEIYSLGTVMFFMYTGIFATDYGVPMSEQKALPMNVKLEKIVQGERNTFETVDATPFPGLEQLIEHCLQSSPEDRFASASELASEMRKLI